MFERWKYKRARKKEIAELEEYIRGVFEAEHKGTKTAQESYDAHQLAHSICQYEENRMDFLQQEDILKKLKTAPFEVPVDYWYEGGWGYEKVLTNKGVAWAAHELDKLKKAKIEFWFKLVVPILALVLSIIALVKKSH